MDAIPPQGQSAFGRSSAGAAPASATDASDAPATSEAALDYVAAAAFGQRQLWMVDQLLPNKAVYNEARADRLKGPLDVGALERAIGEIVRRHDVLRTRFAIVDGDLCQVVAPSRLEALVIEDVGALPAPQREAEARRRAGAEVARPFDLGRGPPFRARLLRLAPDEHWLLVTLHHIVSDRWSGAVFARELSALYAAYVRGESSPLPDLPIQFADYAEWQRELIAGERLERLLAYWTTALADLPTLALPTDRPRPPVASFRGGQLEFEIDEELVRALAELSRREDATLFMTLLAAFQVLLYRLSGQSDVAVGVPVTRRTRPELESLIGFFVNMIVMRGDLGGEPPFTMHLARVRRAALDAYAHGDLPIETLVERLAPSRDLSRNPLYQVGFRFGNTPRHDLLLPGVAVQRVEGIIRETAKFDLSFGINENGNRLRVLVEFAADLFDEATIARMASHYRTLLAAIVAAPGARIDRLPLLAPAERERLLALWNGSSAPYPDATCVHRLVEGVAARMPEAPAVVDGDRVVAYGDLNACANRLARVLRRRVADPAPRIGIFLERGIDLVVAMLGILKAGGAYVPLDPDLPAERLAFMLRDADVGLILTATPLLSRLPWADDRVLCVDRDAAVIAAQPSADSERAESAGAVAYVMYTSGSTGTPKGVLIPHRAIARLVCGTDYIRLDATDAVAQIANPAFDAATFEVWGALANGARIVVVPRLVALSPPEFAAMLEHSGITTLFLTTALFNQVAQVAPRAFGGCRTVLFGGETAEPRWVKAVLDAAPPQRLLHVYGPTETTTFATWHDVRAVPPGAVTIPIGRPLANTEVYVLDAHGEPVPVGVPGELYIGGPGLAVGYLDRPELTAERFVRHPFADDPDARLYRTGDRVRHGSDGALEFLGRLDRQVKIRGHRIELEEVEAVIARLPQVRDAVVALRGDTTDTRQLVAYVVAANASGPPPANLWNDLKSLLPAYMLPASIVWLKALAAQREREGRSPRASRRRHSGCAARPCARGAARHVRAGDRRHLGARARRPRDRSARPLLRARRPLAAGGATHGRDRARDRAGGAAAGIVRRRHGGRTRAPAARRPDRPGGAGRGAQRRRDAPAARIPAWRPDRRRILLPATRPRARS